MKIILKLLISLFLFAEIGAASEIKVFEFTEAELSQLEVRKVRGADTVSYTHLTLPTKRIV